ncbi:MAG: 3-hydroxyacyl-CoA dehydrogenase NAD-binding domain-containing protein [Thermoplasmata archaeon]|nr:3-hydroxyacyl-CoA dehydrogenase NAD-binding domain-containing protein [Thermoplasmata archaeon]
MPETGAEEGDPRRLSRTRVFVLGAGIMGSGIAAQCALKGYAVTLADVTEELVQRGLANALRGLDSAVRKGRVRESERSEAAARIETAIGLRRADSAPIVIEAVPERLELKQQVFRELDAASAPTAMLATNTSSLPVTSIARVVEDPGRVVGLHFFNPVLSMALVEVIPGHSTRPEVADAAVAFARSLGKTVVRSRDSPGFLTSRAVAVGLNEAVWMLYEGVSTRDEIDQAYKLGFGHPMGPLELADLVGLDTALAILDILWDGFHDPKYRACPLLRTLVEAGKLGRKSGEGFYKYEAPPAASGPT